MTSIVGQPEFNGLSLESLLLYVWQSAQTLAPSYRLVLRATEVAAKADGKREM